MKDNLDLIKWAYNQHMIWYCETSKQVDMLPKYPDMYYPSY
jgi:hypothetical protein